MAGAPNDPVDRLLSRSFRERRGEAGEVCPDAEQLAAWAEGALDAREGARIEEHASSCARCAQILSAVAASDPGVPETARAGFWTAWRAWRWAVPMVTAVAVMGLWFGSTRPEVTRNTARQADDYTEPGPNAAASDTSSAPGRGVAVGPPTDAPPSTARPPAREAAKSAPAPEAAPVAPAVAPPPADSEPFVRSLPPAPPPPAAPGPAPASPARVEERVARVGQQSPGGADATEREGAAGARAGGAQTAAESPATRPETTDQARSRQAEPPRDARAQARADPASPVFRTAAPSPLLVRSPDPNALWRVRGTVVERTTDRGVTWRVDYTSQGPIVGGVAPSADVAWFFSPGGLVLRRAPAGWLVSRLPGDAEIASIAATSATEAIVTLAPGGRRLATTDAGRTWVER